MAVGHRKWADERYGHAVAFEEAEVGDAEVGRIERNLLDAFISLRITWLLRIDKRLEICALMRKKGSSKLSQGIMQPVRWIEKIARPRTVH